MTGRRAQIVLEVLLVVCAGVWSWEPRDERNRMADALGTDLGPALDPAVSLRH